MTMFGATEHSLSPHAVIRAAIVAAASALLSFAPAPLFESVTVSLLTNMDFGNVGAGGTAAVTYSESGAASFEVQATGMAGFQKIVLSFSLPTHITNGAESVPITFSSTDAAWNYTNDLATANTFDPSVGAEVAKSGNIFSIYVWVGASVNPGSATPSQLYTETLTLSADIQ